MWWDVIIVLAITICGMWGGQCNKWVRRYLLPAIAVTYPLAKKEKKKWKALWLLSLMGILSMGYGENSKLRKLLKGNDFWTRIVYGLLVSLPFWFLGKGYASIILPIAWSIRAGGFKLPGDKDFLWEDFARYMILGILIVI